VNGTGRGRVGRQGELRRTWTEIKCGLWASPARGAFAYSCSPLHSILWVHSFGDGERTFFVDEIPDQSDQALLADIVKSLLASVKTFESQVAAELKLLVADARQKACSWSEIARFLGKTPQAVQQRFGNCIIATPNVLSPLCGVEALEGRGDALTLAQKALVVEAGMSLLEECLWRLDGFPRAERTLMLIEAAKEVLAAIDLELECLVADARLRGSTWTSIGSLLSCSAQAAQKKFGNTPSLAARKQREAGIQIELRMTRGSDALYELIGRDKNDWYYAYKHYINECATEARKLGMAEDWYLGDVLARALRERRAAL